ncbi:hypothetical protein [Megasphaera sp. UBA4382]|uniref:hypothetical protein n=1 Tax=Megasphaera sp. UBA4382 TaxID=1946850 RepID=UPI0025C3BECA|nr:hypothetical protein [Megasphaera sp. UBA4382]
MKLKKILILLCIIFAVCMPVSADQWYWVGSNEYVSMYVDNNHVNKMDDFAQVYVRVVYADGHSFIGQALVSSSAATIQFPEVAIYDSNGQYRGMRTVPDLMYIQAVPGTLWNTLFNLIF